MAKATNKKSAPAAGKMYIVKTPVKDFCGIGAGGVHFANGQAEIPAGWVLDWYRERGYKITEKKVAEPAQAPDQNPNSNPDEPAAAQE